jgi:ATP-binding cassette subfamily B protein
VPDLVKFTAILFLFHGEILKVATGFKIVSSAAAAEERLRPLWAAAASAPAAVVPAEAPPVPAFRSGLVVAGASTGYAGGQPVLADAGFEIRPGERIALCGPSGAGKTTLVRLLLGLLPPWHGSVTLDGVPVGGMNPAAWRRYFSVAPQDPLLFNMTIGENIAYGRPGASLEEIRNAARLACADEFISGFPLGYDTPAGESGGMMSEGQRQRIAIARALLRDAPLLVLDEPCSNLDARTEREIYDNLAGLSDRSIVLISHRLGAVARADRIYYVDGGRIASAGTHAELLQRSPEYRSIFALQAAWEADAAARSGKGKSRG